VIVIECRKLSKHKAYKVTDVLRQANTFDQVRPNACACCVCPLRPCPARDVRSGTGLMTCLDALQAAAARIAQSRDQAPVPSAVQSAAKQVEETSARLKALKAMYAKELGIGGP
jgi:hypothetical protein